MVLLKKLLYDKNFYLKILNHGINVVRLGNLFGIIRKMSIKIFLREHPLTYFTLYL